jgi:hypothetical protein
MGTKAVRAYFIGGSQDLSCRILEDDGLPYLHLPKSKRLPIRNFGDPIPDVVTIETEIYRRALRCVDFTVFVLEEMLR